MLRGKAFDDRAGCSLLVDVLRGGPYPVEVLAAFTVQEEIGLRGAQVVGQTLQPDVALILEGTTANDLPSLSPLADDETEINPTCCVGKGPTLTIQDASMIVNPKLLAFLKKTADGEKIPYQFKSTAGGGTMVAPFIHQGEACLPRSFRCHAATFTARRRCCCVKIMIGRCGWFRRRCEKLPRQIINRFKRLPDQDSHDKLCLLECD